MVCPGEPDTSLPFRVIVMATSHLLERQTGEEAKVLGQRPSTK
jgi:hypothetical protein